MFVKFSEKAQKALVIAESCAYQLSHQEVTTEHLLLALLKMPELSLTKSLKKYMVTDKKIMERLKHKESLKGAIYIEYSDELRYVIETSMKQATSKKVSADLFGIVLIQQNCYAKTLLEEYGVDLAYVRQFLKEKRENSLKQIPELIDLNEKVRKKGITIIGRDNELELLMEMLCRKEKNNAIIIGDAGVGKTALVEKLAGKLNNLDCQHPLYKKVVYELDLPSVLAGTKYRGDFEEKLKKIIFALKQDPHAIVFIDEIHNLVDAGKAEGAIDASNILKPYLARGELSCIGATTYIEYNKYFESDPALNRRFAKIELKEEGDEAIFLVLKGLKNSYEKFHHVSISDNILKEIIFLTSTHMKDRHQPDKSLDVLDLCCVKARMENKKELTIGNVEEVVESLCGFKFNQNTSWDLMYEHLLNKYPIYKNELDTFCEGLKKGKMSFVCIGGKYLHRMVKDMSKYIHRHLLCYRMGEYNDHYALQRLLGTDVSNDKCKSLLQEVKRYPECIILVDDFECANLSVVHFFSKLLEEKEYDHIDFKHAILIFNVKGMNANIGFKKNKDVGMLFPGVSIQTDEIIYFTKQD